jgi:hypothetical protein
VLAVDPLNANVQSAAGNFTHIVVYDGNQRNPIGEIPPGMLAGTTITKILSIASGWTMLHGSVLGAPVDVIPPSGGTTGSGGGSTAPKGGGGGKGKKSRAR